MKMYDIIAIATCSGMIFSYVEDDKLLFALNAVLLINMTLLNLK